MKRWKKLLLLLLLLVLISQIPFAYRRYKLGRLHAAIQQLNSQRVAPSDNSQLIEYKGVVHVHSFLGGHSTGNFEDIIAAAQANQLDFVMMTEHPSKNFNTAAMTLSEEHGGMLFVDGNEVSTASGDRLLLLPGDWRAASASSLSTQEVLASRKDDGVTLVAYPNEFKSWEQSGYKGLEVYNVYTNARRINALVMFFDALWSYRAYPDLLFANFYRRPTENLKIWDEEIQRKGERLVATAGNDSHANVGISLNDSTGKTLLGTKLDPYERSFRLVRMHVIVSPLHSLDPRHPALIVDKWVLLTSLAAGHCFIAFDLFGDASGFRYAAHDRDENRIMGDEIKLEDQVTLSVSVPIPARILLLKDGSVLYDESGIRTRDFTVSEKGSYRVEAYLPQLPGPAGNQPWIISNPIYVR
jgi:hypothetical protein